MNAKTGIQIVNLPLWYLITALGGVLAAALMLLLIKRRQAERERSRSVNEEPDWTIPTVDEVAEGDSVFHRWDVRFKLAALFAYAFFVVSLKSLDVACAALFVSLLAVIIAGIPATRALRRIAAMAGFVGMFVIVLPLTVPDHPGDTVLVFGGLPWTALNMRGLVRALTIVAKAVAVALLMEPMLATAPFAKTLEALTRLGIPRKITQMVMLSSRYVYVFGDEARRMSTGMKMRGFQKRTRLETLRTVAHFVGMLFVRSFDRTYRVNDAMLARGFRGEFPLYREFRAGWSDWVLAALWMFLGIGLIVTDRFILGGWS